VAEGVIVVAEFARPSGAVTFRVMPERLLVPQTTAVWLSLFSITVAAAGSTSSPKIEVVAGSISIRETFVPYVLSMLLFANAVAFPDLASANAVGSTLEVASNRRVTGGVTTFATVIPPNFIGG
jgi:hypothetical protein